MTSDLGRRARLVLPERDRRLLHPRDRRPGASSCAAAPEAEAVIEAGAEAHAIEPGQLTLGTDNGSAFTARRFRARLEELGDHPPPRRLPRPRVARPSSSPGSGSSRSAWIWRSEYETLDDARAAIAAYVERYHHRPHSGLGYRTPKEVRKTWEDAQEIEATTKSRGLRCQRWRGPGQYTDPTAPAFAERPQRRARSPSLLLGSAKLRQLAAAASSSVGDPLAPKPRLRGPRSDRPAATTRKSHAARRSSSARHAEPEHQLCLCFGVAASHSSEELGVGGLAFFAKLDPVVEGGFRCQRLSCEPVGQPPRIAVTILSSTSASVLSSVPSRLTAASCRARLPPLRHGSESTTRTHRGPSKRAEMLSLLHAIYFKYRTWQEIARPESADQRPGARHRRFV